MRGSDTGQRVYISSLVPLGAETLVIGKPLDVKWLPTVIALPYGVRAMLLTLVVHKSFPVARFEVPVWMVTDKPSQGCSEIDCCVLFLSSFFLSSVRSVSLLMVSMHISTTPRQANLSWPSSRQYCSISHFTKSRCTRSFQQHFWPPADPAPCAGAHTNSCLGSHESGILEMWPTKQRWHAKSKE